MSEEMQFPGGYIPKGKEGDMFEGPDWAGGEFKADDLVKFDMFGDRYKAAAAYLRAIGFKPNQDAIEQLADGFTPSLKLICERPYAGDGKIWRNGGWRGLLHEMIKKIDRLKWLDWEHDMADAALKELPDFLNYGAMYMRSRKSIDRWGTTFGEPGNWGDVNAPEVVTLCGSTRFIDLFHKINLQETVLGRVVLSIGCDRHNDDDLARVNDLGIDFDAVKPELDKLHKRKIDMSVRIIVISDESGYIGESTRSEIDYAIAHDKKVVWLNEATERNYFQS